MGNYVSQSLKGGGVITVRNETIEITKNGVTHKYPLNNPKSGLSVASNGSIVVINGVTYDTNNLPPVASIQERQQKTIMNRLRKWVGR